MTNFGPGAIDLAQLKQKRDSQQSSRATQGGWEPFITVTDANMEDEVIRRSLQIPVIVHIGSTRSPDSEELKTTLESLAGGQRQFRVAYIDADSTPMLAQMLGVRALPTVIALAAGRPVTSFEGNQPKEQLRTWVETLVQQIGPQLEGLGEGDGEEASSEAESETDPRLDAATEALNIGDFDAAISVYDDILSQEPTRSDIKQARATVGVLKRLDQRKRTTDTDPVAEANADKSDVEKQLAAADAEAVAGAAEKAFDRLLALVATQPRAKERLLELFTLFESSDPRVISARTALASALF